MTTQTVLIVDDDIAVLELFTIAFDQAGFKVLTAKSGKQALELIQEQGVDLITLDYNMPELSGLDVLKALRSNFGLSDLKVIMVTANDVVQLDPTIYALADLTLLKPISFNQLVQLASRLIEQDSIAKFE